MNSEIHKEVRDNNGNALAQREGVEESIKVSAVEFQGSSRPIV